LLRCEAIVIVFLLDGPRVHRGLHSFPTRRSSDLNPADRDRLFDLLVWMNKAMKKSLEGRTYDYRQEQARLENAYWDDELNFYFRSEEHTSELQSRENLVCRLLLEKKNTQ